jgi:hypothetical protein
MATEWNGEGIPPVGTECEATWGAKVAWMRCVILPENKVYLKKSTGWEVQSVDDCWGGPFEFRPLQSEEQKQVVELTDIIIVANYSDSVTAFEVAKAIYNAGFRKVVE